MKLIKRLLARLNLYDVVGEPFCAECGWRLSLCNCEVRKGEKRV